MAISSAELPVFANEVAMLKKQRLQIKRGRRKIQRWQLFSRNTPYFGIWFIWWWKRRLYHETNLSANCCRNHWTRFLKLKNIHTYTMSHPHYSFIMISCYYHIHCAINGFHTFLRAWEQNSWKLCHVETFNPEIEIWDLDVLNCIEPKYTLKGGHSDAVLLLSLYPTRKYVY